MSDDLPSGEEVMCGIFFLCVLFGFIAMIQGC